MTTREVRARLADVVQDAIDGRTTYITQRGRRRAAVVPTARADEPSAEAADPDLGVPPDRLKLAAARELAGRGLTMADLVTASLAAVGKNPEPYLTALAKYWPEQRKRGAAKR